LSVQLVSNISNLCDPDPPTASAQTDGRTDGQTDGRHAISVPRGKNYLDRRLCQICTDIEETKIIIVCRYIFVNVRFLPRDASAERGYEIHVVRPSVRLSVRP